MITKQKQAAAPAVVPAVESSIALRTPDVIATEIRSIEFQARQLVSQIAGQANIEIGKRLLEAKDTVEHGDWGKWLKDNVNYSQSTANNFMKIAKEYGDSNFQAFENLGYSHLMLLSSVPAEEREAFAEEVGADDMSTRELQAAIKAREEAEANLAEEKRLKEEQKAKFDAWAADRAKEKQELEDRHNLSAELRQQAEKQVEELTAELEKAKAGGDDKAIAKAKAELREADKEKQAQEKKAADLQKQLDELKANAEQEASDRLAKLEQELKEQAEQEKKGLQDQLSKLEEKLKRSSNPDYQRAKVLVSQYKDAGKNLIESIGKVKEEKENGDLKKAVAAIIDDLRTFL